MSSCSPPQPVYWVATGQDVRSHWRKHRAPGLCLTANLRRNFHTIHERLGIIKTPWTNQQTYKNTNRRSFDDTRNSRTAKFNMYHECACLIQQACTWDKAISEQHSKDVVMLWCGPKVCTHVWTNLWIATRRNRSEVNASRYGYGHRYPELGMEAVWKIEVIDFPAFIVVNDQGQDFFKKWLG